VNWGCSFVVMFIGSSKCLLYIDMFFKIVVLGGGTLLHCCIVRFLQCINYIILEFTPSSTSLYSPSADSWNSFNRYYFCIYMHVYMCFALYSLYYPFSIPLALSQWCQSSPLSRICSVLLFSDLQKKKTEKIKRKT
jgi:hypothetical protein